MFLLHLLDQPEKNNDDDQNPKKLDFKDDPASVQRGSVGLEEGSGGKGEETPSQDIWLGLVTLNWATTGLPETPSPLLLPQAPPPPPPLPPITTSSVPPTQHSKVRGQLQSMNELPDKTNPLDSPQVVSAMTLSSL